MLGVAAGAVFLLSLYCALRYKAQPILEMHSFRQTQTALTTYWLNRTGFHFAYWTPCCGAPWSVPYEFPIYEWIVSLLAGVFRWDLQQTGRLVTYAFALLCLLPVRIIFRQLYPERGPELFFCFALLYLSSPLYLFWGRSFLMETAALFFALCFIAAAIPLAQLEFAWRPAALTGCFLTLALLQKSTTGLPAAVVICGVFAWNAVRCRWYARVRARQIAQLAVAFALPLLLGFFWIRFSDSVKMQNAVGAHLTSAALNYFNYGTLHQRWSRTIYREVLWERMMMENAGGWLGLLLLGAAAFWLDRKTRVLLGLSALLFLLPFLAFENLHWVHNYYQVSICIYLLIAVSLSASGLTVRYRQIAPVLYLCVLLIALHNLLVFRRGYWRLESGREETGKQTLRLSEVIRKQTDPARPILVFGYDYSSEVQFFSERKGLALPGWMMTEYAADVLAHPAKYLGGDMPSAIVACDFGGAQKSLVDSYLRSHRSVDVQACRVVFL